ncbi:MAG: metallophosphoesterase [Anaerolineales bacterium]|nr:metallophosphoesterase [Anaerolineales bacterium]
MRLAIFSDIHGNRFALEAVLNALLADGPFDAVIAAGDLALGGGRPCAVRRPSAGSWCPGCVWQYRQIPDRTGKSSP